MVNIPPLLKKFILPAVVFLLLVISPAYRKGYGKPDTGIDDANIYFAYMKNFARYIV